MGDDCTGEAPSGRLQTRNGRLVVARRPSHTWTVRGRGPKAAVLLPPAPKASPLGKARQSLVSIPRPDGHPTWFVYVSAASRIGSRTDPSHCSPRRRIGGGEARDWLHLDDRGDHRDHRSPLGRWPVGSLP